MPFRFQVKFFLKLMLPMLVLVFLQACAVGIMKVEGPQLPLIKNPVSIDREVYFEVCVPPEWRNTGMRDVRYKKIKAVLKQNSIMVGLSEAPPPDKPYLFFLFNEKPDYSNFASMFISLLTFSAVPGYTVNQTKIAILFVARDANGNMVQETYKYEYRERYFLWLPFIFYPDVVGSVNGAYTNPRKENQGLELVLKRFIYDASDRISQQPKVGKAVNELPALECPVP